MKIKKKEREQEEDIKKGPEYVEEERGLERKREG